MCTFKACHFKPFIIYNGTLYVFAFPFSVYGFKGYPARQHGHEGSAFREEAHIDSLGSGFKRDDLGDHLFILQCKLCGYLPGFIEGGLCVYHRDVDLPVFTGKSAAAMDRPGVEYYFVIYFGIQVGFAGFIGKAQRGIHLFIVPFFLKLILCMYKNGIGPGVADLQGFVEKEIGPGVTHKLRISSYPVIALVKRVG
ncbi:hypothetical protein D9M68_672970 [compost metagenome]